jgi:hypothetical protein
MTRSFFLILLTLTTGSLIHPQSPEITGMITDKRTRQPLAFVNIVYNDAGHGTVSDIDGRFSFSSADNIDFLKISYVGYHSVYLAGEDILHGKHLEIKLEEKSYEIPQVDILPGINPAHRIIRLATENRRLNNPEEMSSFSYTSYSKMYFTLDMDSIYVWREQSAAGSGIPGTASDSAGSELDEDIAEMEEFLEKQHLFLMEFVSHREFMHPDRNRERVLASRVSGFKDPSFTLLATQIQSFSFYEDLFMIWDKKYLNPISQGSTRKYLFVLEDTLFTQMQDTLFVISYRPLRNRNFDGLKGILHINSKGYAIQHVIAEAAELRGMWTVRIQQKYEQIDGRQWFPVQLNTDIILNPELTEANDMPVSLVGIGKSYLSDIILDPELNRRDFNHIELIIEDDAHKKGDPYWESYRVMPLTGRDTNTYAFLDSIGEEANLDRNLKILETVATGYIPVKFLNVETRSLLHWNRYEGLRFGLAAETNQRISPWFSIGGKAAYGTRDRQFKYGGHLKLNLNQRADAFLALCYSRDVMESAGISFLERPSITSSAFFRLFMIARMDLAEEREASLQLPLFRYLKMRAYLNRNSRQVTDDYLYDSDPGSGESLTNRFELLTTGFQLRFAYGEKFMETPRGNLISLGTNYPVLQANAAFGLPLMGGEYEYTRLEALLSKKFISKSLGETKICLRGGTVDRDVPFPLLYAGVGSYGKFTLESENSFATMRMNEFTASRFASVHFQQDFGKLLIKGDKFQPGIALAASAGFGALDHEQNHINLPGKAYDLGYYEAGILFNNLLNQAFMGYGLGAFYRMGPYTLPKTIDNFAFKMTVRFNL